MQKRVGILTLYYKSKNFGGLLQSYALQKAISDFGCDCEQISYQLSATPVKIKLENAIHYGGIRNILNIKKFFEKFLHKLFANKIQKEMCSRIEAFELFEKEIPHSKEVYNYKTIRKSLVDYDTYVVGSDQIWNAGIDLETFLLKFAGEKKGKIAYAASSGGITYKGFQKKLMKGELCKFDALSVRENSLKKQIISLTEKPVENVIDPVFLLSYDEWKKVLKPSKIKEPYIFCYFLGTNRKQRKIVEEIAKKKGYQLVVFPYIVGNVLRFCDMKYGTIRDFVSGPAEFLGLLEGAEYVITDSFHALSFSVIFQKNFCVFPRYEGNRESKSNSRMKDFLHIIEEEKRFVYTKEETEQIWNNEEDYKANEKLEEWIEISKIWLQEALRYERN